MKKAFYTLLSLVTIAMLCVALAMSLAGERLTPVGGGPRLVYVIDESIPVCVVFDRMSGVGGVVEHGLCLSIISQRNGGVPW